jgi:serine protease Do
MQGMTLLPAEPTRVTDVVSDGPASVAGVKVGDVIVAIDGEPIPDGRIFTEKIRARQPRSTVVLRIRRGGEESELGVVLGDRPKHVLAHGEGWLGLTLTGGSKMIFDPKTKTWTKTEWWPLEAKVSRVDPNGPASAAGILRNDVILALEHEPIATGKELSDKLRLREPGSTALLRVKRGDDIQDIKVVLGTRPSVRELGAVP